MKEHENILVFANAKWTYNKQMQERAASGKARSKYLVEHNAQDRQAYRKFEGRKHHQISELRVPSSWLKFNIEVGLHPTQKPVALFEYLILTYTNTGDLVLDNCIGVGTTAVACIRTGRRYYGIDSNEGYCQIARQRIKDELAQLTFL